MCKFIQLQIVLLIAMLLGPMNIVAPDAEAAEILFLGAQDPPTGGDPGAIEHLESLGHTVTYLIGDDAFEDDVTGQDLLVISSTLPSGTVRGKFEDIPEPILTWESSMVRAMDGEFWISEDQQSGDNGSFITVVDASHPIMAGIDVQDGGELEMFIDDQNFFGLIGDIAPGATVVAVGAPPCCDEDRTQIVALPAGAESLSGDPSPGLRISLPVSDTSFDFLSDVGIQIFNNAVDFALGGEKPAVLEAGDADQDFDFDQLDLVMVQIAGKYLTGQDATWGEGDWNGAPGGEPGNPPPGNNRFDQIDIIAALGANTYLTGPYAAINRDGQPNDGQTSIIYDVSTGEVAVDAPAGTDLTSVNIDSAAGIFTGDAAQNLGGSFDNDADNNIFKATFGSSFGSLTFGNVAQAGLSEEFVLNDLTVVGSLAGGGDLGNVDLIYVPEPASALLLAFGIAIALACFRRANG